MRPRHEPRRRLFPALLLALLCGHAGAATLARATLVVSDLEASVAFYRDLLGFRENARMRYDTPAVRTMFNVPAGATPTLVLLDGDDQPRALGLVAAEGMAVDAEANRIHAPALVTTTEDIAGLHQRLRSAGTPVVYPPTPLRAFDGSLMGREAMYLDPDGVRIVVFDYGTAGDASADDDTPGKAKH